MPKTYADKLQDPRWQRMRLQVLSRDNWTCRTCGDSTSTLHVHHQEYTAGREPWEYDPSVLVTLCERCHAAKHLPPAPKPSMAGLNDHERRLVELNRRAAAEGADSRALFAEKQALIAEIKAAGVVVRPGYILMRYA